MDAPSRLDVERQLRLVLASNEFETSPKLSELLYYLVNETLAGNAELLKGYTIGVDVFDRQPDFDQGVDAIVRVQMGRLRKLLTAYYQATGSADPIRFILVPGRYAPRFEAESEEILAPAETPSALQSADAEADAAAPPATSAAPEPAKADGPSPNTPDRHKLLLLIMLGAVVLAGIVAATTIYLTQAAPAPQDPATARPTGPMIYIARYEVLGDNPLGEQIATGLQYDLTHQLAKFPEIAVLGLDSVDGTNAAAATENALGATFMLGGAVEISGDAVRITSQLTRMRDKLVIWSDQSSAARLRPATIMQVQADIAANVASKLGQPYGVVAQAMTEEIANLADPSLDSYKCVLSAYAYMRDKTQAAHRRARDCLEHVVAETPNYATAWALLSWVYGDEARYEFNRQQRSEAPFVRSLRAAERAVSADSRSATAHEYLSIARFHMGNDDDGARASAETALQLSPNDSEVLADAGWTYALLDGNERARQLVLKAIELNPGHPGWYWGALAIHALQNELKDDALKYARLNKSDSGPMSTFLLAAALRLNGDGKQADAELVRLAQTYPQVIRERDQIMRVLRIPPHMEVLIYGN